MKFPDFSLTFPDRQAFIPRRGVAEKERLMGFQGTRRREFFKTYVFRYDSQCNRNYAADETQVDYKYVSQGGQLRESSITTI